MWQGKITICMLSLDTLDAQGQWWIGSLIRLNMKKIVFSPAHCLRRVSPVSRKSLLHRANSDLQQLDGRWSSRWQLLDLLVVSLKSSMVVRSKYLLFAVFSSFSFLVLPGWTASCFLSLSLSTMRIVQYARILFNAKMIYHQRMKDDEKGVLQ